MFIHVLDICLIFINLPMSISINFLKRFQFNNAIINLNRSIAFRYSILLFQFYYLLLLKLFKKFSSYERSKILNINESKVEDELKHKTNNWNTKNDSDKFGTLTNDYKSM